jgi:hypothetical protein
VALRPKCAQDMSCVNPLPEMLTLLQWRTLVSTRNGRPGYKQSFQRRQRKISLELAEILLIFHTPHPSVNVAHPFPYRRCGRPRSPSTTPTPGETIPTQLRTGAGRTGTDGAGRKICARRLLVMHLARPLPRLVPCSPPPVPSGVTPHIQVRSRLASATDSALVRQATSVCCMIWFRKLPFERVSG